MTTEPDQGALNEILQRYRRAGNSNDPTVNLRTWIDSANDVPFLLALVESVQEHQRRAEDACRSGWQTEWEPVGRDRDGNLELRHLESGGVYRLMPVEDL